MHDVEEFSKEMQRQAQATLKAHEPDLANAVLDQVFGEICRHPEHLRLQTLAARIGAGVIAEYLGLKRLDGAESAWTRIHQTIILPGHALDAETRAQAAQCAYNILMGRIAQGHARKAQEVFLTLMGLAELPAPVVQADELLAGAALRLVAVGLQLHPPQDVYADFAPLRSAQARHESNLTIARCRARASLLLCAAFARSGDPDFARTLADEARAAIALDPDDSIMDEVAENLNRLYST